MMYDQKHFFFYVACFAMRLAAISCYQSTFYNIHLQTCSYRLCYAFNFFHTQSHTSCFLIGPHSQFRNNTEVDRFMKMSFFKMYLPSAVKQKKGFNTAFPKI